MATLTRQGFSNRSRPRAPKLVRGSRFGNAAQNGASKFGPDGVAVPRALASQRRHRHGTGGIDAPAQRPTYGCVKVPWQ